MVVMTEESPMRASGTHLSKLSCSSINLLKFSPLQNYQILDSYVLCSQAGGACDIVELRAGPVSICKVCADVL